MSLSILRHRLNTLDELRRIPAGYGAEIDLRSAGEEIVLSHDAFRGGDLFHAFVQEWRSRPRGPLILNPKEDGLEAHAIEELEKAGIQNFFFLDLTIPTTVRLTRQGERRIAIRYSEFEPTELAARFRGKAEWIWADCFDGTPPDLSTLSALRQDFRICLVSPELQGYPKEQIDTFLPLRNEVHAVCTKHPDRWESR